MNNSRFLISEQAKRDINDVWVYTRENWSKEQADRYYNLLISEMQFVANYFFAGKSIERIRKGYRVTRVKSHLIFYRRTETEVIEIVRVLHQRMDVTKHLK